LYEWGTWSATLKEEHRLMVYENKVLRKYLDMRGKKGEKLEKTA
jgi:hypothetical protein